MLRQWFEPWEDVRYEPAEFIDGGGDLVIVVTRMRVRSRTGLEMANTTFYVYTIVDGRITRIRGVPSRSAAFRIAAQEGR
jgi:ketosteroid isomerase-like protein